jgi:hypothetical protein
MNRIDAKQGGPAMTAPTVNSAYPASVDDLIPQAQQLTAKLGEIPSRNRLKRELKVGSPKAAAVREALIRADPGAPEPALVDPGTPELPTDPAPVADTPAPDASPQADTHADPGTGPIMRRRMRSWPVWVLAIPATVAIWSGWVGIGGMTGFGVVHPLPGIWDSLAINTAITLPIGVEAYAAYALRAWLSPGVPRPARRFAKWSAIGSLLLGASGQVAYHLMESAGITEAPWQITTVVSCLPVAVLGMGAALAHLIHADEDR